MDITMNLPDLAVVGTGIEKFSHMTLEVYNLLQESEVIIGNSNDPIFLETCNREFDAEFYDFTHQGYDSKDNEKRFQTYVENILTPLEFAKERDGLVTNMTVGHPTTYSFTTNAVNTIGEEYWGLDVEVYAGVSSSTAIYADLNFNPSRCGLVQESASSFIERDMDVDSRHSLMLWLVGRLEYDYDWDKPYTLLEEELKKIHRDDKYVYFVRSSKSPFTTSGVRRITLNRLHTLDSQNTESIYGSSLLIFGEEYEQPIEDKFPPRWDEEVVDIMKSGKPRDNRFPLQQFDSMLDEAGHSELADFLHKATTDFDFLFDIMEDGEQAIEARGFDLSDEELEYVLEKYNQTEKLLSTYINDIQTNVVEERS